MTKPRILMITMAMLLSAIGCMLSIVGGSQHKPFSTEPWLDSLACTTDWYQYPIGDGTQDWQAILSDRIATIDLDMELLGVSNAGSGNSPCYQPEPPNLHAIELRIHVPSEIIEDDTALGYRVRRIILIIESYHDDLAPANDGILTIHFISLSPDYLYARWSFQYSQVLRAVEAHLSSRELFAIGGRR